MCHNPGVRGSEGTLVGVAVVVVVRPKTVWYVCVVVTAIFGAASRSWAVNVLPQLMPLLELQGARGGYRRGTTSPPPQRFTNTCAPVKQLSGPAAALFSAATSVNVKCTYFM